MSLPQVRESVNRLKSCGPLFVLIAAYITVRSRFWNCQPIWDGAEFALALFRANHRPFKLLNYSLDAHVCQGFFLVLSLPYLWFKQDYYRFNLWLSLFCVLGIIAFYRLLRILTGGRVGAIELTLATALFAFHPTVLASMIHFTLDIGLVIFVLWYWVLLLENRMWLATLAGTLLMLTKEPAVAMLPLIVLFCFLWQPPGSRRVWLCRHWLAVVAPYCAFVFILADKWLHKQPLFWNQFASTSNVLLSNYAGLVFVLNFGWLFLLLSLGLCGWLLVRPRGREETFAKTRLIGFLFMLATGLVFCSRPYSNARYVMVPVAILLLGSTYLVLAVVPSRGARLGILVALLALLGAADVRTVDPLSKAFFGTFNFGRHPLLAISQRTGECGGVSRDQLVYNLEFLNFAQLTRKMIKDVRPAGDTFILCAPAAQWFLLPMLDTQTGKPTLDVQNSFLPRYTDMLIEPGIGKFQIAGKPYSLSDLPKELYFVEYPNADYQNQIASLNTRYAHKSEKSYDINGYQITVVHFADQLP